MKALFFFFSTFIISSLLTAQSITLTFQPDDTYGYDAFISNYNFSTTNYTNQNFGNNEQLGMRYQKLYSKNGSVVVENLKSFLYFDDLQALINSHATITSATLELFAWPSSTGMGQHTGVDNSFYIGVANAAWDETTVTYSNSSVGYNSNTAIIVPGPTSPTQNYSINVLSLIQQMQPNQPFGFVFDLVNQSGNAKKVVNFCSSDYPISSLRPKLTITFEPDVICNLDRINDALVLEWQGNPNQANTNYGSNPQIMAKVDHNGLVTARSFLSFPGTVDNIISSNLLNQNIVIQSAYLELTPWDDLSGSGPSAFNNQYPNNTFVQRLTSNFDPNTITWNNQTNVTYTTSNQVTIPSSQIVANSNPLPISIDVKPLIEDAILYGQDFGFRLVLENENSTKLSNMNSIMNFCSSEILSFDPAAVNSIPKLCISYYYVTNNNNNKMYQSLTDSEAESDILNEIFLFPNPTNSTVKIVGLAEGATLEIVDLAGKVQLSKIIDGSELVNVENLKTGIYIVKLNLPDGTVKTQKLIKSE